MELYETSAPPGNNGGAVSGAAPCAAAAETRSRVITNSDRGVPHFERKSLGVPTGLSSSANKNVGAHLCVSRESTGIRSDAEGQDRYRSRLRGTMRTLSDSAGR